MYYGVSYDEVPADEAVDLALTLPNGSLYVARKHPELSWSEARELSADIRDDMAAVAYALRGLDGAPRVLRPADVVADARAKRRAREAKTRMEGSGWEPVEGG